MIRVWKCEFCCHTEKSVEKMIEHENNICSHNPRFKMCYSCANYYTHWENECCKKDLSVFAGQDDGNCIGWETDDIKLIRKLKLKQLNEKI